MADWLRLWLLATEKSSQNQLAKVRRVIISKTQESPSRWSQLKVSG
jgi:hypothetical protein